MNQQLHVGSSAPSPGPPVKRRRGRPRKDESLSKAPRLNLNVPYKFQPQSQSDLGKGKSPSYKANTSPSDVNVEDQMIGRVVIGVLEGTFDAGYFLNMRVGETEIFLQGIVFQPGKFVPITSENDVTPLARTYSRTDLPSPLLESLVELPNEGSILECEFSVTKERLEVLASLSVEMDELGEKTECDQRHELAQQAISDEELKAATTLNQLEFLLKQHEKSLDCENKQAIV